MTIAELGLERLSAEELWDSIEDEGTSPIDVETTAELDRRIADFDANPGASIPWEVAKEQLLARGPR